MYYGVDLGCCHVQRIPIVAHSPHQRCVLRSMRVHDRDRGDIANPSKTPEQERRDQQAVEKVFDRIYRQTQRSKSPKSHVGLTAKFLRLKSRPFSPV
jgi:hypothetical protein